MKPLNRLGIILGLVSAACFANSKDFRYELTNINSFNGYISYPGLDLNGATSADIRVSQASPFDEPQIESVIIDFPNAERLVARNFQSGDFPGYRAIVNNVWIYRQVIVEVHGSELNPYSNDFFHIAVYVSEKQGFVNPNNEQLGELIVNVDGELVNTSPSRVVDREAVTVNGDRLIMRLKSSLGAPDSSNEPHFVIDATWLGNGEETLYIPLGFSGDEAAFFEPVAIELQAFNMPDGQDYDITITAKDHDGYEIPGPTFPLSDILEQAYGPLP